MVISDGVSQASSVRIDLSKNRRSDFDADAVVKPSVSLLLSLVEHP